MNRTCTAIFAACMLTSVTIANDNSDAKFEQLGKQYIDQFAKFSPVNATSMGDHRFDGELDDVSDTARKSKLAWLRDLAKRIEGIEATQLSRSNQVDYALLKHSIEYRQWKIAELREWQWNPLVYTGISGNALYSLMARDFAPRRERLLNAAKRLEQFPRFFDQVRNVLVAQRVPEVHARTAVAQNRGVLKTIDNYIRPFLADLSSDERRRIETAIRTAENAVRKHQQWLEAELLQSAKGDYRLGIERYERKLAFALHSPLRRQEIRELGQRRIESLHDQMYVIAKPFYRKQYPLTRFPDKPSDPFRRAVIRFGLEKAYQESPKADEIVQTAQRSVADATEFLRKKDVISLVPDPLEIIVMPEFRRGVSLAYCDSPGPLETNQPTFYAVSPPPADWTDTQVKSHLREYNTRSLDVLTIHEAMPGHFLQLAHANRYEGKLRHLFQSGVFVEGWAVYTEWMMCEEGFREQDPLLKLITLKWYLRDVTNALLDQAIHVDGVSRSEGMRMMVEDAFQEEREAAGKWTRAQLTSAQLPTYFVGYLEHVALRRDAEKLGGDDFDLKTYHDKVLSFGSPPPQFVRALVLDLPIP
ncbi:hypothetical protein CA13_57760 [Planctomycetes bacterium CA13]|uniref:DUF885 domain-containing protein n=1 Tax=Novipirellula herctigrandis TaxID=2527986 RepID=A0A5C5ZAA5_9BACT|nr:hypothetical protein CA13_57760 [Planctomycetes bacterium CA13]